MFAPSLVLIAGALPLSERLRALPRAQAVLMGVKAAVVGILLALYNRVWTSAIHSLADLGLALLTLVALMRLKLPTSAVVAG